MRFADANYGKAFIGQINAIKEQLKTLQAQQQQQQQQQSSTSEATTASDSSSSNATASSSEGNTNNNNTNTTNNNNTSTNNNNNNNTSHAPTVTKTDLVEGKGEGIGWNTTILLTGKVWRLANEDELLNNNNNNNNSNNNSATPLEGDLLAEFRKSNMLKLQLTPDQRTGFYAFNAGLYGMKLHGVRRIVIPSAFTSEAQAPSLPSFVPRNCGIIAQVTLRRIDRTGGGESGSNNSNSNSNNEVNNNSSNSNNNQQNVNNINNNSTNTPSNPSNISSFLTSLLNPQTPFSASSASFSAELSAILDLQREIAKTRLELEEEREKSRIEKVNKNSPDLLGNFY